MRKFMQRVDALIKLRYVPVQMVFTGAFIHQRERLCARLSPAIHRESEKEYSRIPGE